MGLAANIALFALLSAPAFCADMVITKTKHKDGVSFPGIEIPAEDWTEVSWIAKDRMRCEEGDHVTIVRTDLDYITEKLSGEFARMGGKRLLIVGGAGFLGYYLVQSVLHWNRTAASPI